MPATALPKAIQDTMAAWTSPNMHFDDVKHQMQEIVTDTKQQKEQSLAARRALADTTKRFKRCVKTAETTGNQLPTNDAASVACGAALEALTKECRVTVKAYQEEIDNLTRRCKASEQGISGALMALSDLSDPATALATLQQTVQEQQAEMEALQETVKQQQLDANKISSKGKNASLSSEDHEELLQLRKEVAEYEVEFRGLKNQDITIRNLEDKIAQMETLGAERMESSLEEAKEQMALSEGRRATEALEREAAMEARVQSLLVQVRAAQAGQEATQHSMLEADEGLLRREAAWEAQRKILSDDNERVREAHQTVLRERDELKLKVAAMGAPPRSGGISLAASEEDAAVKDLMLERSAYDAEVSPCLPVCCDPASFTPFDHMLLSLPCRCRSSLKPTQSCKRNSAQKTKRSKQIDASSRARWMLWKRKRKA